MKLEDGLRLIMNISGSDSRRFRNEPMGCSIVSRSVPSGTLDEINFNQWLGCHVRLVWRSALAVTSRRP